MNRILVIGSAVADVNITLPHLPVTGEDVHVRTQHMNLGGCGMNTFDTMRHLQADAIPFFPVGSGAYGEFVKEQMHLRGISSPIPRPEEANGCCYCFIEEDGERTFLSYHGAEYRFHPEWFSLIDPEQIGYVYVCGLEIEEKTGIHIISFLEKLRAERPSVKIFFAPGPRISMLAGEKFSRMLSLGPILHLNRQEAKEAVTLTDGVSSAADRDNAAHLYAVTHAPVIITLGSEGCCYYAPSAPSSISDANTEPFGHIPAVPVHQTDANGAGDAHIGAVIAALQAGKTLPQAITIANRVSSLVVSLPGATVPDELFPAGLLA